MRVYQLIIIAVAVGLLAATTQADLIIDDDFVGNEPGVPPGWTIGGEFVTDEDVGGESTVSLQRAGDLDASVRFNSTVNPQLGMTVIGEIEQSSGETCLDFLEDWENWGYAQLRVAINASSGELSVRTWTAGGVHDAYNLTHLSSTGPLTVTAVFDDTGFSVSTDVDGYSSGHLLWTTAFSNGFTLADLGTAMEGGLSEGQGYSGLATFDRYTLTVVPEPASLSLLALGGLAALLRRLR